MKSKFLNKVVFIDDKRFHNKSNTSPYIFILSMDEINKKVVSINVIDIRGRKKIIDYDLESMYKNFDILNFSHINKEFVKGVFNEI